MSRASQYRRPMRSVVQALGGPEIEVVAKARRRRFPLNYKRKILREVDRCRTAGARRTGARGPGRTDDEKARPRGARSRTPRHANRPVGARERVLAETS